MKIGIIIGSIGFGGAERVAVRLALWFVKNGHSVSFFTTKRAPEKEYEIPPSINRYNCNSDGGKAQIILNLRKNLKTDKPDAVIVMGTPMCVYAVPALMGLHIPFIVSERSSPKNANVKGSTRILSRKLMNFADYFIFQTNDAKKCFSEKIQSRSKVVPNPIVADEIPARFQGARDKRIVAVGRLIKEKNYPMLIDALEIVLKKHSEYCLEIYGDGKEKENIQKLIKDKGLTDKIRLMGVCSDVLSRINSASLFVLPSDFEGMPNALLEAMSLGLACVSTNCPCGGPADLIENGVNGILVPVSDSEKMAEAISLCLDDAEMMQKLGNNALKIKQRLDINIIAEQWLEVIKKITDK